MESLISEEKTDEILAGSLLNGVVGQGNNKRISHSIGCQGGDWKRKRSRMVFKDGNYPRRSPIPSKNTSIDL